MSVTINRETLAQLLREVKGATPATIVTVTVPAMNKTNNPFYGGLEKVTEANVFINFKYENSVNNARKKEGEETDFHASPRQWGQRIAGTPLVQHKDELYLEARYLKSVKTDFFFNNTPIAKSELAGYLKEANSNAVHQGLEKEVIIRDTKLTNIREIKFAKEHYIIQG